MSYLRANLSVSCVSDFFPSLDIARENGGLDRRDSRSDEIDSN